jgi:preprotein translocase subunit YajC
MTLQTTLFSLAQGQSGGGGASSLVFMVLIVGVFYFLMIRPQQRKQKEHRALLSAVKQGDKVVAAGGIVGTVRRVEDDTLHLQVADNVVIKVDKGTVAKKFQDAP